MKNSKIGFQSLMIALIATACLFITPNTPARPQDGAHPGKPVITIDGAAEPDRIPDWILWRELLTVAEMLANKVPDSGREIWIDRLGLTQVEMNSLIAHGRALREEEKGIDLEVKSIIKAAQGGIDGPTKGRLHQIKADKDSRILIRRDLLKSDIGMHAFLKLQSFARLHIAPTVKVGTFEQDAK